jgi:hypothetical protein
MMMIAFYYLKKDKLAFRAVVLRPQQIIARCAYNFLKQKKKLSTDAQRASEWSEIASMQSKRGAFRT